MDERLKKAISKGKEERDTEYQKELERKRREEAKRVAHIASFEKVADEWVNKYLFEMISNAEKEGRNNIGLPHAQGIPNEAMVIAIRKIKGLAVSSELVNYCDDYGKSEEWYVTWEKPKEISMHDFLPTHYSTWR